MLHIILHMQASGRAVTKRIRGTGGRRTAVLFARVSANQRPQVEPMGARLRCVEALAQAAELSGGRVLRRQGDAIMALFATADAAAAAATRMHAYVESGGRQAAELKVRIGLQSGPVTQDGPDVLGDTVNLALEFSRLAQNGQIVTSAETAAGLNPGVQAAVGHEPFAGLSVERGEPTNRWLYLRHPRIGNAVRARVRRSAEG